MLALLKKYYLHLIIFLALAIPFALAARTVLTGSFPFWFDNGRDLLLAWGNLSKPTLIGPPSGIPGIFYGPYWIWLLSVAELISRNPAIVDFLVATLPYFILFPLILWQFHSVIGKPAVISIWLLFILSQGNQYATQLWNPHLAPLIFLGLLYLLVFTDRTKTDRDTQRKTLATGAVAGLLINFHISFGIGIFVGTVLFFVYEYIVQLRQPHVQLQKLVVRSLQTYALFGLGMLIIFLPTVWFEFRHGFHESEAVLQTLGRYGDVVKLKALTKSEIVREFLSQFGQLVHLQTWLGYVFEGLAVLVTIYALISKKLTLTTLEKKLSVMLITMSVGVLSIYLSAKNPVWSYHFIGTEIMFLLAIGLMIKKLPLLKYVLGVWALVLLLTAISFAYHHPITHHAPDLYSKEKIVSLITTDASAQPFTVFIYSPSIYTYEFTYLYQWQTAKNVPYDPGLITMGDSLVYLSIPPGGEPALVEDFEHYRTPDNEYKTAQTWNLDDGSTILKRVKKN